MFGLPLALLGLTACKPVEPDPLAVAPDETIRPLAGPWSVGGAQLALASGTALSDEAGPGGAGVAMAAWTREGQLWLSSTFNAGAAWTTPRSLGPAPTGDSPPTLLVSPAGLALAFVLDGRPTRLVMTDRGFASGSPAEAAVARHVTAIDHEGTIWLAWVDHRDPERPTLRAWTEGEEELILQDAPICDGPIALGVVDGALTVAARLGREAGSGVRTFARDVEGWTPRGAWLEDAAPCFADAPRVGPTRDCLSDICARADRGGKLQLDGLLFVADPSVSLTHFTGSAELAWDSPAPVAGVAAVWMVPVGNLQLPIAPTLLIGANQTWRDYGGNVIHSHGGALALNVGGLVSGGVGFGHHNTLPINFYDLDGDGAFEQGELRLGSQRVSPYLYVGVTPVTFVRLVGRQWLRR